MKKITLLKLLFLSLVISSCGLIERFKTPEQPTDTVSNNETKDDSQKDHDDLFGNSLNDTSKSSESDAPSNIASEEPIFVEETIPEIKVEIAETKVLDGGTMEIYKVQKGETLMQIAFKLYGDVNKWKDLKAMNKDKVANNSSLRANMNLKYMAPETPFVWNPAGEPYMIKNGDTLGTISNNVYATKKKWKTIWENNKPLITNPNIIFAGFTLYYKKNPTMANYVQPAAAQPILTKAETKSEEVMIEKLLEENTQVDLKEENMKEEKNN